MLLFLVMWVISFSMFCCNGLLMLNCTMQDPSKFAVAAAPVAVADTAAAPAAAKEEEKKEEPAEVSDDDMGFSLFDQSYFVER